MARLGNDLSVQLRVVFDDLAKEFERKFRQGALPSIEDYLNRLPQLRTMLLERLLAMEVRLRRSTNEEPTVGEYLLRFPQDSTLVEAYFLRQARTDEVLKLVRSTDSIQTTPAEVVAFRRAGGRVQFTKSTAVLDVEIKRWSSSNEWRMILLHQLSKLKRIRSIKMTVGGEYADELLQAVSDSSELREVDLSFTSLTNEGLRHVATYRLLESLDLSSTRITDAGLSACSALPLLSKLSLSGTSINDQGIRAFQSLAGLQSLDLSNTNVSDSAIPFLRGLPRLQTLDLCSTLVTDAAIDSLAQFPALASVDLTSSLVSHEAVQKFAGRRPKVDVAWSPSLKLIGYWHSEFGEQEEQNGFIHPCKVVDPNWEREFRAEIIRYLTTSPVVANFRGLSNCRFGCGENGSAEQSDGVWIWPEGLAHYVEQHNVTLPPAFVAHMKDQQFNVDTQADELPTSTALWRSWCCQHT